MKVGRVVSVGRSMIKNFIYLYWISDGPGLTKGDTMDPVILNGVATITAVCPGDGLFSGRPSGSQGCGPPLPLFLTVTQLNQH